jgi:hypothetical protein
MTWFGGGKSRMGGAAILGMKVVARQAGVAYLGR